MQNTVGVYKTIKYFINYAIEADFSANLSDTPSQCHRVEYVWVLPQVEPRMLYLCHSVLAYFCTLAHFVKGET